MITTDNKRFAGRTIGDWRELEKRYFDAGTTEEEESELRRFAASDLAAGAGFDELRAVMGFAAMGKSVRRRKPGSRRRAVLRYASAAAVAAVIGLSGWFAFGNGNDRCVAYIGGVKCTDKEVVFRHMHKSMQSMGDVGQDDGVDAALSDLFDTINESNS